MVFDVMITNMESNEKLSPIITELFLRERKLNISLFLSQSYFKVPKTVRLNATHYFIMKTPKKENFDKLHRIICLLLNLIL